MDKDKKKNAPSEPNKTEQKKLPQKLDNYGLDLFKWVKPPSTHVGANANLNVSNRNWSVKGAFGTGAVGFLTYSGYCLCTKKPFARPLLASIAFGGVYLFLDNRDRTASSKASKKDAPNGENKEGNGENGQNDNQNKNQDGEDLNTTINKAEEITEDYINGLIPVGGLIVEFGPTGSLKSILCAQTGISLAEGVVPEYAPNGGTVKDSLDVVLFDAELTKKNIKKRYGKHGYIYPKNYVRITNCRYGTVDEFLNLVEKKALKQKRDSLFILDNLTAACPSLGKGATQDFYDRLKAIQAKVDNNGITITFIVVCHVTKSYETGKPIELKHLAGSANIFNFATNVIAIGPTKFGEDMKMIKVLKDRDNQPPENVYLVKVEEKPYVHLKYNSCLSEKDALPEKAKAKGKDGEIALSKSGKPLSESQLTNMQLLLAKGEKGPEEIADEVGCSRDTVQRWKRKWIEEGKLP